MILSARRDDLRWPRHEGATEDEQEAFQQRPPSALDAATAVPVVSTFVCWRAKRGTSLATGPDFWEATRKPAPPDTA
jgi:hypothetical protein